MEGWVGHALDPVGVLFDTLTEVSVNTDDPPQPDPLSRRLLSDDNISCLPPRYHHVAIPGNRDRNESYLTMAIQAALISEFNLVLSSVFSIL